MSRYAIVKFADNNQHGGFVLGRFGELAVIDQTRYNNESSDEIQRALAEDYLQFLEDQESANLCAKATGGSL